MIPVWSCSVFLPKWAGTLKDDTNICPQCRYTMETVSVKTIIQETFIIVQHNHNHIYIIIRCRKAGATSGNETQSWAIIGFWLSIDNNCVGKPPGKYLLGKDYDTICMRK